MFAGVAVVPVCSPPKLCRASCFMFLIKHQEFISAAVRLLVFSLARFTVVGSVLLNMKLVDSHRYYCVFMSCSGSGSSRSRWVQSCNVWPALCHHSVGSKCRWTWWTSLTAPDLCWSFSTFGANKHMSWHMAAILSVSPASYFMQTGPGQRARTSLSALVAPVMSSSSRLLWSLRCSLILSVMRRFDEEWNKRVFQFWSCSAWSDTCGPEQIHCGHVISSMTPAQIITENIILMWFSKTG